MYTEKCDKNIFLTYGEEVITLYQQNHQTHSPANFVTKLIRPRSREHGATAVGLQAITLKRAQKERVLYRDQSSITWSGELSDAARYKTYVHSVLEISQATFYP